MIGSFKTIQVLLLTLFGALAAVPWVGDAYIVFVAELMLIYIVLAIGLNLLIGYAGQFAFSHAAMFGIGAYATGLTMLDAHLPFPLALLCGMLAAGTVGVLISIPAFRLSGVYLGLTTLAFAEFTSWVMVHGKSVTRGASGFSVPAISFNPFPVSNATGTFYVAWFSAVVVLFFAWRLVRSRIGRAFAAIRDDETSAEALGINIRLYKGIAFGTSSALAGLAGGLFAVTLGYVSPESFDITQMVLQLTMILFGGLGSLAGSVFGAASIVVLNEVTRELKGVQEIVYGVLLLLFVRFQPRGIAAIAARLLPGWREDMHMPAESQRPESTIPEMSGGNVPKEGVSS
jgi:branched-chain amino acid transport system permease protein